MSCHTANLRMKKVILLFFLFTKERKGKYNNTQGSRCVRKLGVLCMSMYMYSRAAMGQDMVREKLLQDQGKMREGYFQSGKI